MTTPMIYFLVGFIVATALVFILGRFSRCKKREEFDERQLKVRGDAFKYGFFTMMIGLAIQIVVMVTDETGSNIYFTSSMLIFVAGLTVYAVYAIWNDGFIGINTNAKSTIVIDVAVVLVNLFGGLNALLTKDAIEEYYSLNGYIPGFMNLAIAGSFIIILIAMLLKKLANKNED